jgi:hypothetical protein
LQGFSISKGILLSGAIVNLKVEFKKDVCSASMMRGKLMMLGKVKVFVIGEELYGVGRFKKNIILHAKSFDTGNEFAIINGIIFLVQRIYGSRITQERVGPIC